jgi:hypothetical protein|tara:strand:- start:15467 stop:15631 length:165 start_codon:yes stop_codon:yes gene_type:complete
MPRIGYDLSLEPSLDEEDYIHETSDDFEEDYESKWENAQQDRMDDLAREIDEKF